ncbi:MAG TPA: HYR domain-containing protein [Thermoanaerobaculia bacterium]|nr:HYR domain-containing protein [Thermoanaerobaculia bacterium]
MRRAIGVAMAFLFSLPVLAGTITSLSPSSILLSSGEHFMTVHGSGLSEGDTLVFDGPMGRFDVDSTAIDGGGAITGWLPLEITYKPGTYSVYVKSSNGDSEPATFIVYKPGRLPLKLHLPEYVTVLAKSRLGTGIKYDVGISGGDGSSVSVSCEPASGSTFPYGVSKISCSAWNQGGERDDDTVQVNVWDGTPPVIKLPSKLEAMADDEKGAYVKFEVYAEDDIDGPLPVTCDRESGSLFPNGRTNVRCEAVDAALNPNAGLFEVFVQPRDPGRLEIKVPEKVSAAATDKYGAYVEYEVYAYGSADPDPVVECTPASGSYFMIGGTKVGCTAIDDFGARAEATFYVDVYERSLMVKDIDAEATSPNGADVDFDPRPDEDWKDAVVCTPESGSLFSFGTTDVECNSTDDDGEKVTGKFKVKVADTTAPHIENVQGIVGSFDPERKIVPVDISVETIDAGDSQPQCMIAALTSDTAVQWQSRSALSAELFNETGAPRTFRVQVSCVDASGNRTTANVPLAIGKGKVAKIQ